MYMTDEEKDDLAFNDWEATAEFELNQMIIAFNIINGKILVADAEEFTESYNSMFEDAKDYSFGDNYYDFREEFIELFNIKMKAT